VPAPLPRHPAVAYLFLVRQQCRVNRLLRIIAGVILGAAIFAGGSVKLLWLFSDNNVSINVYNDSKIELRKIERTCVPE
jgi:hypothetical protein